MRHVRLLLRLGFGVALVLVFWLALLPVPEDFVVLFSWQDKLEHFLLFGGLTALGLAAWPGRARSVIALVLAYGVAMEVAQSFTAYRSGDPLDWLADALGAVAAAWLFRRVATKPTGGA